LAEAYVVHDVEAERARTVTASVDESGEGVGEATFAIGCGGDAGKQQSGRAGLVRVQTV
jgi:hypothetical protein